MSFLPASPFNFKRRHHDADRRWQQRINFRGLSEEVVIERCILESVPLPARCHFIRQYTHLPGHLSIRKNTDFEKIRRFYRGWRVGNFLSIGKWKEKYKIKDKR
jgi:hypothetical protein